MHSAKEIAAGLRELHTNNDDTRTFLRTAADYIERTAAASDIDERARAIAIDALGSDYPNLDVMGIPAGAEIFTAVVEAVKRGLSVQPAAPADLVLETTTEERAIAVATCDEMRRQGIHVGDTLAERLIRDLDKAIAFAASETKRADEAEREAKGRSYHMHECEQIAGKALGYPWYKDDQQNFPDATEKDGVCIGEHVADSIVQELANAYERAIAERDREAAARRKAVAERVKWEAEARMDDATVSSYRDRAEQAEAGRATLRAALTAVTTELSQLQGQWRPGAFYEAVPRVLEGARAALATTSTVEGS